MGCGCGRNKNNNEERSSRMPVNKNKSNHVSPKRKLSHKEILENRARLLRKNEKMRESTPLNPQQIEKIVRKRRGNK